MTQQPYGGPQQAMGFPPPQAQAAPTAPPVSADAFFDGIGGTGAPSFKFNGLNDGVRGTIVDQYATVVTDTSGNTKFYPQRAGEAPRPIPQLNVTLQTSLRNWDHVNKIPEDENGNPKPPSEDDGLRRIYVKYDMRNAVGRALQAAKVTGGLQNGGELAVKLTGYKPTNQPNPLPLYEARYTAPSASAGFDFGGQAPQAAPQQQAPVQQQAAPAAQNDPWAVGPQATPQAAPGGFQDEPPF